jgi:hypothetical protein
MSDIERQISDFITLIDSHFARLVEIVQQQTRWLSPATREQVAQDSLVIAFRQRDLFDPQFESVIHWFGGCVALAKGGGVETTDDEKALLAALSANEAPPVEKTPVLFEPVESTKADPIQKHGKDCPPCWRCRYFDGWLPRGTPKPYPVGNDGGVAEAMANLDRRKLEIANWVRGTYPEELLED